MYILASQSPRRKQLMSLDISRDFKIVVSHADESYPQGLEPSEVVRYIATKKGEVVHKEYEHDTVISADTIVVLDNEIIGKPKDEEDAYNMLKKLSGRTHIVYTGYAIFEDDTLVTNVVKSEVVFNELSDKLIKKYIKTGSPLDKAGAYGYQDSDKHFPIVNKLIGSEKNVIGFPTDEIKLDLKKLKIKKMIKEALK